jgi:hypothetical protein
LVKDTPEPPNNNTIVQLWEWIARSLHSGDVNGSRAALSSSYLESSIKVALALTNQIIQAEQLGSYGISNKLNALPVSGDIDWA